MRDRRPPARLPLNPMHTKPAARRPGPRPAARRRPRRGFTLIELLVVISLIALLIALLLPALVGAKSLARATQCASQLRDLSIGWQLYLDDHDGNFPVWPNSWNPIWTWGGGDPKAQAWRPINRYIASPQTYICPDDQGILSVSPNPGQPGLGGMKLHEFTRGNSYPLNSLLTQGEQPSFRDKTALRRSDIEFSHSLVVLAGDPDSFYFQRRSNPDNHFRWIAPGHEPAYVDRQAINFLYLDGHVSFQRLTERSIHNDRYTYLLFREQLEEDEEPEQLAP